MGNSNQTRAQAGESEEPVCLCLPCHFAGLPGGSDGKESPACSAGEREFDPWDQKIPWRRKWQSTPALLPGEFHGQKSLAGYSSLGLKESGTTEQLTFSLQVHVVRLLITQCLNLILTVSG